MVESELSRLIDDATRRWPLLGVTAIHRHGRINAGEGIVLVATASAHRAAAFAAAEFLMDWLKTNAPFWKREIRSDGTVGDWVEAKESDDTAAQRWAMDRAAE
jgi:molybdopterin synthase catalytic subunit